MSKYYYPLLNLMDNLLISTYFTLIINSFANTRISFHVLYEKQHTIIGYLLFLLLITINIYYCEIK